VLNIFSLKKIGFVFGLGPFLYIFETWISPSRALLFSIDDSWDQQTHMAMFWISRSTSMISAIAQWI